MKEKEAIDAETNHTSCASVSKKSRDYSRLPGVIEVSSKWSCERASCRASAQGSSNAQIACELDVCVDTVRMLRDRWAGLQGIDLETLSLAGRLQDAPRPGTTPTFTAEQRCQMAALACEAPAKAGRPISQWTGREIADEMKGRGIVSRSHHGTPHACSKRGLPAPPLPLLANRGGRSATGRENR